MEDFTQVLQALVLANKAMVGALITFFIGALIVWRFWEEVNYFLLRVWHSFPLVGTIAKLARTPSSVHSDGWIDHEVTLAKVYHREFKKYKRGPQSFKQAENYLSKIGESGRSARPFWVMAVIFILVAVEAIGFGYVLASWMNMDASDNTRLWMAAGFAILLSIASAVAAEAAGHALHHNKLVAGARHDFLACSSETRDKDLVRGLQISLDDTFNDDNLPAYKQQVARIKDVNATVTKSYAWIIACITLVTVVAVGAFIVRSATLESIETEMVNGMRSEMNMASSDSMASPFDLPEESQAVDNEAAEATIEDKMAAIRKASLTTYVMLSAIYIAIQGISIWLASIYYFGGVHSRKAYEITHKYATVEDLLDEMDQKRSAIASHADDKLRRLRDKLKGVAHTKSSVLDALDGKHTSHRTFLDYVEHKADKISQPRTAQVSPETTTTTEVQTDNPSPVQPSIAPAAPAAAVVATTEPVQVAAPATDIDAATFHDVTELPDESLGVASRGLRITEEQLRDIREQQRTLKSFGAFPLKKTEGSVS